MNSVEIFEFKFDSKTEDLLKQLSDDNKSENSVCFEEIEYSEDEQSTLLTETVSTDTDYDSLDEESLTLDDEFARLCTLDSPWKKYSKRELIGTGSR